MPIQLDNKSSSNVERLDRSFMRNGVYHIGEHPEGISPLEAVNLYRDSLSLHERKEILRYEKVRFFLI
uniref:Dual-specificity kinase n=1 Tax=Schistosoma mansoni TaxID=6183 RepID=A0A5K4F1H9_SCHMA